MEKPWIAIPTRYHSPTETLGQIRHYLDAIVWAGGLPLMIPTVSDESLVGEYAKVAHGILLPGSPTDIDPAIYGAEPHEKLGRPYPERDSTDRALLERAGRTRLPVLGICFGAQSLNVFRGGTLVQDIPSLVAGALRHDNDEADDANPEMHARHFVRLTRGTVLAGLAKAEDVETNSFHHQAIERPGRNLRIAAVAPDGVIEAVEDTENPFVIGIQWHPERTWKTDPLSRSVFQAFVEHARKFQSRALSV